MQNSNSFSQNSSKNLANSKYNGRWTNEQHQSFLQGLKMYGKNWKRIETIVKTRTGSQIRSHAQKFFNKINQCKNKTKIEGNSQKQPEYEEKSISYGETNLEDSQHKKQLKFLTLFVLLSIEF